MVLKCAYVMIYIYELRKQMQHRPLGNTLEWPWIAKDF